VGDAWGVGVGFCEEAGVVLVEDYFVNDPVTGRKVRFQFGI
jgi:hypothetical protein